MTAPPSTFPRKEPLLLVVFLVFLLVLFVFLLPTPTSPAISPFIRLVHTTRVPEKRREKTKKSLKIGMLDSQAYRQDRPQGLKKKK